MKKNTIFIVLFFVISIFGLGTLFLLWNIENTEEGDASKRVNIQSEFSLFGGTTLPSTKTSNNSLFGDTTLPPPPEDDYILINEPISNLSGQFSPILDIFGNNEPLLNVFYKNGEVKFVAGRKDSNYYIWNKIYISRDGKNWDSSPLTLTGNDQAQGWVIHEASATSSFTDAEMKNVNYASIYLCTKVESEWKCGCSGTICTGDDAREWSLQSFLFLEASWTSTGDISLCEGTRTYRCGTEEDSDGFFETSSALCHEDTDGSITHITSESHEKYDDYINSQCPDNACTKAGESEKTYRCGNKDNSAGFFETSSAWCHEDTDGTITHITSESHEKYDDYANYKCSSVDNCANVSCPTGQVCKDGECVSSGSPPVNKCANVSCSTGETCKDGECVSSGQNPPPLSACSGSEVCEGRNNGDAFCDGDRHLRKCTESNGCLALSSEDCKHTFGNDKRGECVNNQCVEKKDDNDDLPLGCEGNNNIDQKKINEKEEKLIKETRKCVLESFLPGSDKLTRACQRVAWKKVFGKVNKPCKYAAWQSVNYWTEWK